MSSGRRRLIWAGAGLMLGCLAAWLQAVADLWAINCRTSGMGIEPIALDHWLKLRLDGFALGLGIAPFLWHFGLGAALPQMLRPGFVVTSLLWAGVVLVPLSFPEIWHHCDRKGSDAMSWLAGCAVFALPAVAVTLLLSRLVPDRRCR